MNEWMDGWIDGSITSITDCFLLWCMCVHRWHGVHVCRVSARTRPGRRLCVGHWLAKYEVAHTRWGGRRGEVVAAVHVINDVVYTCMYSISVCMYVCVCVCVCEVKEY
jgi:hypothetical protein